jgi:hypothetical protein
MAIAEQCPKTSDLITPLPGPNYNDTGMAVAIYLNMVHNPQCQDMKHIMPGENPLVHLLA